MRRYDKKFKDKSILSADQDLSNLSPQHRWSVKNRDKLYSYQKKYRNSEKYKQKYKQKLEQAKWSRNNTKRFFAFTDEEFDVLKQKVNTSDLKGKMNYLMAYYDYHRERLTYQYLIDNNDKYKLDDDVTKYKISKMFNQFNGVIINLMKTNDKNNDI